MSDLRLSERSNEVITVTGRRGSGKSFLIAQRIVPRFPRVVTVDWTGEARETYPRAFEVYGLGAIVDALQEVHREYRGKDNQPGRWHIIAVCDPTDVGKLCSVLAPRYDGGKTPALAAVVGGLALECHEMDVVAPVSGAGPQAAQVADAIARGRHARLSWICAAQRPAQVLRLLTSQSDSIYAFRTHEPRDLQWLRQAGGEGFADVARGLAPRHAARYDAASGKIFVVDPGGVERIARAAQVEAFAAADDDDDDDEGDDDA